MRLIKPVTLSTLDNCVEPNKLNSICLHSFLIVGQVECLVDFITSVLNETTVLFMKEKFASIKPREFVNTMNV